MSISPADQAILAAYLLATVAFGLWIGRGQRGVADYLLGGRDLPWWALLGSVVATETSTATFLSVPGVAFAAGGDFRFLQLAFGYIIGRVLVAAILLPQYFRGRLYTAYEVLEKRFGPATKRAASILFLVTRNLGDGVRLFLTAIVLEHVAGLPLPRCIWIIGAATIVYTVGGGMKSVVWNDCIQFAVYMAGGVLALSIIVSGLPGGWGELQAFAAEHGKFRLFDFTADLTQTYTFWAGIVGGVFLTLGTHGTDQMLVQRYLCARSQRDAGRALVLSGVVVLGQFALFLLLGAGLACFFALEAYRPGQPLAGDEALAYFIVHHMPVGVTGLTLAAVFSAAMSTLSSSLNSSAASAVNDLYLPMYRGAARAHKSGQTPFRVARTGEIEPIDREMGSDPSSSQDASDVRADEPATTKLEARSERHLLRVSRVLTVVFGVVQIEIGIVAASLVKSVVNAVLAIAGFSAGILLGVFFLGVWTRRVGQLSTLFGMLIGLLVLTGVLFATPIAWPWFALIGAATTFAVGFSDARLADWIGGARDAGVRGEQARR